MCWLKGAVEAIVLLTWRTSQGGRWNLLFTIRQPVIILVIFFHRNLWCHNMIAGNPSALWSGFVIILTAPSYLVMLGWTSLVLDCHMMLAHSWRSSCQLHRVSYTLWACIYEGNEKEKVRAMIKKTKEKRKVEKKKKEIMRGKIKKSWEKKKKIQEGKK